ncbi:hypothetical protein [Flavobacterium cerinum]|uniref:Right-handed parallel beta-helix repeat-containing protein n=1 Tax=Flavobacterium cerinum TaxID=2502784 RepID=A0ABY5IP83_9FLAO|nr:hypothetical protein [Flavobacterium cerinum]UUC44045.1 hypothetical protein NOX80_10415 [Flavobacterium cerinum]
MRHYYYVLVTLLLIALSSCRNDFSFEPSTGNLEFSKDTIYLDTVFSNIGSSTYTLKVYNRSNKDIKIPSVRLGQGDASKYRLMVDGIPGKVFNNVELLAKDSMYIFVETTINYNDFSAPDAQYLYTDKIEFDYGTNYQKVDLVTLVKDAYFIYPGRNNGVYEQVEVGVDEEGNTLTTRGRNLNHNHPINGDEFFWKKDKPYVIYGYAAVPSGETLNVQAGARVHFHAESGLIVQQGASLKVAGTKSVTEALENEVIFQGDRLEQDFSEVPGQWGTIWLRNGSTAHDLKNLTIKNAVVGILTEGNDGTDTTLKMTNVQIYNSANVGLLARNAHIKGDNIVINKAGQAGLACTFGGKYHFSQSTFANYWSRPNQVAVTIDNGSDQQMIPLEMAQFDNCILFGSSNIPLSMIKHNSVAFNFRFNNCLIKFFDIAQQFTNNTLFPLANTTDYNNCRIAVNSNSFKPDFKNPNKNQLIIGDNSDAKAFGGMTNPFLEDILGNPRPNGGSDLGAYNHIVFDN